MSAVTVAHAWAYFMAAHAVMLLALLLWSDVLRRQPGALFFAIFGSFVGQLALVLVLGLVFGTVPNALETLF